MQHVPVFTPSLGKPLASSITCRFRPRVAMISIYLLENSRRNDFNLTGGSSRRDDFNLPSGSSRRDDFSLPAGSSCINPITTWSFTSPTPPREKKNVDFWDFQTLFFSSFFVAVTRSILTNKNAASRPNCHLMRDAKVTFNFLSPKHNWDGSVCFRYFPVYECMICHSVCERKNTLKSISKIKNQRKKTLRAAERLWIP